VLLAARGSFTPHCINTALIHNMAGSLLDINTLEALLLISIFQPRDARRDAGKVRDHN